MFPPEAPFFLEQGKGIQISFAVRGEKMRTKPSEAGS